MNLVAFLRSWRMRFRLRRLPAVQQERVKVLDLVSRAAGRYRAGYTTPLATVEAEGFLENPLLDIRANLMAACEAAGVPQEFIDHFSNRYR